MSSKQNRIIKWTALLAGVFISAQLAAIILKGDAFCFKQGCEIIEGLTTIAPMYINLAGLGYFLAIYVVTLLARPGSRYAHAWLRLVLLTGLAAEGVLVSYQLFVAQTVCSYCLIIFLFVVLLNVVCGWRQLLLGAAIFAAILLAFNSLNFGSARIFTQAQDLASGTLATKNPGGAGPEMFLFFSSDCPHCRNVLDALEGDNSCAINFNPIDQIETIDVAGLQYSADYRHNPALNRLILSLLDIRTIPVLLAKNRDGMTFVKGEQAIIDFIRATCFEPQIDLSSGSSSEDATMGVSTDTEPAGECEIEVACPDPDGQSTSSAY